MSLLNAVRILRPDATMDQIEFYLQPIIEQAQPCLDNYSEEAQNQALAYLFAHLTQQAGGGQITSERTRTGAQRSYATLTGTGLNSTQYGQFLSNMSGPAECLRAVIDNGKRFAVSINPKKGRC